MKANSKLSELMEGISKEDFEYIEQTNRRPKNVDFDRYKALLALIHKTNKQSNFKPKKFHK